jgi:ABC-type uncharacterized transport system ATPase subunit
VYGPGQDREEGKPDHNGRPQPAAPGAKPKDQQAGEVIILLDEPTAGMTREETVRTAHLVAALARTALVLVVEHNMDFVRQLGAPITVMHQGRIFKQGSLEEIQRDEDVLHIYLGRQVDAVR